MGARMFERFSDRARMVMAHANQEAHRLNHEYIGTEHVLLGLLKSSQCTAARVLAEMGVEPDRVRHEVERLVAAGPDMLIMGKLPLTPRSRQVIESAIEEARALGHHYVGTEHILLGLLRVHDGVAAMVLTTFKVDLERCRQEVIAVVGTGLQEESASGTAAQQIRTLAMEIRQRTRAMERDLKQAIRRGQDERVLSMQERLDEARAVLDGIAKRLEEMLARLQ